MNKWLKGFRTLRVKLLSNYCDCSAKTELNFFHFRYDSLIDTVDRKFGSKRKRNQHHDEGHLDRAKPSKKHKPQFKKPKED
jgi:hypothetical protein